MPLRVDNTRRPIRVISSITPATFITQLGMLGTGIVEEFNWVYAFLALVPFLFFPKLHRRERAWMIGITAIYFFLGVLLLILLNPPPGPAGTRPRPCVLHRVAHSDCPDGRLWA